MNDQSSRGGTVEIDGDIAKRILASSDGLFMLVGPDGIIQWANEAAGILGYSADETIGRNVIDFLHPDEIERAAAAFDVQVAEREFKLRTTTAFRLLTAEGAYSECDVAAWPIGGGTLAISVRQTLDARLLRTLLTELLAGNDPVEALGGLLALVSERDDFTRCTIDLSDGEDSSRIAGSQLDSALLGYADPAGGPWAIARETGRDVRLDQLDDLSHDVRDAAREAGLGAVWVIPVPGVAGEPPAGLISMWIAEGGPPLVVNSYLVTLLPPLAALVMRWHRSRQELEVAAQTDGLTELPNRRRFMDLVGDALARSGRRREVAVLYIDLDEFKPINDIYGHAVGDRVLVECARRMVGAVRGNDTVGRVGGDEFVILLDRADRDLAHVAARVIGALEEPIDLDGNQVRVSASIGIAVECSEDTADDLLARADGALYRAKAAGRGRAIHEGVPME